MNSNAISYSKAMGKSLLLSYGLTVLLLTALAFVMYQMKLSIDLATWGTTAICFLSCGLGGVLVGKQVGNRRFLWGLLSGVLYFCVLLILSWILGDNNVPWGEMARALAICLVGSMVGAVLS